MRPQILKNIDTLSISIFINQTTIQNLEYVLKLNLQDYVKSNYNLDLDGLNFVEFLKDKGDFPNEFNTILDCIELLKNANKSIQKEIDKLNGELSLIKDVVKSL